MDNDLHLGTCSWKFGDWRGLVYSDAPHPNYLAEYSRKYGCVEINGSGASSVPARLPCQSPRMSWITRTRRRSGLTLGEIGQAFGIGEYKTVAAEINRFEKAIMKSADKARLIKERLGEMQKMET